ncbi:MAG: acetate kinase [Bacteroidales bacterium]|nr:acetate kinase [Bacteroidales bacterium]
MKILVINCGSSSLKYQVLEMSSDSSKVLAKGLVERIGSQNAGHTHKVGDNKYQFEKPIIDHTEAIKNVLNALIDPTMGVISSLFEIDAVGHRVAHGGDYFFKSVAVDDDVVAKIEKCCALAPLHNPANLLGIRAMAKLMPDTSQVAVFDTSFHQTMPDYAYMYALDYSFYEKYKIRRYGFHGTSHKFVAEKACKLLGMDINNSKIITCHLGNGSSITAIKNGKSIDTSMGFTPLEGVPMGTRCGNIDAGLVTFLMQNEGLDADGINSLLNKKSGLQGLSGFSSDCRDLVESMEQGNNRAALAIKKLAYDVKKYIGAYAAVMNGVDLIILTGGIGENSTPVRELICSGLDYLGVDFDFDKNTQSRGIDTLICKDGSKVKVMAVTTDEELVIATDTMNIVKNK